MYYNIVGSGVTKIIIAITRKGSDMKAVFTNGSSVFKRFILLLAFLGTANAFAERVFTVCYHNLSSTPVEYINDGVSHKWKSRGQLVGSGAVAPKETKCFKDIKDETIFSTDYITFTLGKDEGNQTYTRWVGIVDGAVTKPYVIAQNVVDTNTGKLADNVDSGKDSYELHIFVKNDGTFIYSNSKDINDTDAYITPRKFK